MHRLRKAAVLAAALATVGFAAGTAHAGGEHGGHVWQSSNCKDHDLNLDLLGEVGLLNGLLGNALNGEGDPGAQGTHVGSTMGCDNRGGGW
ncbi:hypothetical protein AQI95_18535 [Streptomyces yokosukanensis]|uniref:Secreted protein n=1 Tax=Streptomyces yokosukanensis TaxID=67386 RepID=A0A101P4P2_9ACTN|nr:hypothetical protein [Streptomyces yokosukanensis]KUN04877.1 hypothetical protein AQI95_18535 [Streptomyces yokosukanensis]